MLGLMRDLGFHSQVYLVYCPVNTVLQRKIDLIPFWSCIYFAGCSAVLERGGGGRRAMFVRVVVWKKLL